MNFQHARGADRRWWCVGIPSVAPVLGACQPWSSCRYAIGLLLLAAFGCSPTARNRESDASTRLFVWAWDVNHDAKAFLAVVDVDRSSATYGQVVSTLPTLTGSEAHHIEYEMT